MLFSTVLYRLCWNATQTNRLSILVASCFLWMTKFMLRQHAVSLNDMLDEIKTFVRILR